MLHRGQRAQRTVVRRALRRRRRWARHEPLVLRFDKQVSDPTAVVSHRAQRYHMANGARDHARNRGDRLQRHGSVDVLLTEERIGRNAQQADRRVSDPVGQRVGLAVARQANVELLQRVRRPRAVQKLLAGRPRLHRMHDGCARRHRPGSGGRRWTRRRSSGGCGRCCGHGRRTDRQRRYRGEALPAGRPHGAAGAGDGPPQCGRHSGRRPSQRHCDRACTERRCYAKCHVSACESAERQCAVSW